MKNNLKYLFFLMLVYLTANTAIADSSTAQSDNSSVFNQGFGNQKQITDSQFKKTVEQMKERSLTKKQKKIKAQVQPHSPLADEEHLKQFAQSQDPDNELSQTLTVMIPVQAYDENGKSVQPGYYKLSCRKLSKDNYVLDLSQGTKRMLTVEAKQTKQDLEQDTIQFCNAEIISNGRIRLMYGSIDLNLVAYLYFD